MTFTLLFFGMFRHLIPIFAESRLLPAYSPQTHAMNQRI